MFRFIEKLQNSDEDTKHRWMLILTAVAMTIVIFVWLAYFNNLVAGFSAAPEPVTEETGFGFWATMKNGIAIVYGGSIDKLRWLGGILGEPREYIIPPQ